MTFLYLYVQNQQTNYNLRRSNVFLLFFLRILIFKVDRIHELIYRTRSINEYTWSRLSMQSVEQQKNYNYLDPVWTEASQDIPDRVFLIVKIPPVF